MRLSAPTLGLLVLLAGCVAPPAETPVETESNEGASLLPFPDPMGHDHDHADPAIHEHAWGLEMTSHHPLAGSPTHSSGAHALDLKAGYLFAAIYGGEADAEGGFFIFDTNADPTQPVEVGRFRFPGPLGGDRSMEATDDADFVVLGTELLDCAGHVNPFAPGLYLVDVRDKALPKIAWYVPPESGFGVHSVTIHRVDGEDYVFAAMGGQNVFRIVKGPIPMLEKVGELPIGHDTMALDDPLLEKPLLFSSNGGGGFTVWDISAPATPKVLAEWNIPQRGDGMYYIHTGHVSVIDGKRLAVVTSEDWEDYPSALWLLDMTDLGDIELLSNWSAPGAHAAEGLRYSMHNPRFFGEQIALSYYHGGAWLLDVSDDAKRAAPQIVGQFMPSEPGGAAAKPKTAFVADRLCGVFNLADAPLTFDVEAGDGVIYVADLPTGLYTVKPTA